MPKPVQNTQELPEDEFEDLVIVLTRAADDLTARWARNRMLMRTAETSMLRNIVNVIDQELADLSKRHPELQKAFLTRIAEVEAETEDAPTKAEPLYKVGDRIAFWDENTDQVRRGSVTKVTPVHTIIVPPDEDPDAFDPYSVPETSYDVEYYDTKGVHRKTTVFESNTQASDESTQLRMEIPTND